MNISRQEGFRLDLRANQKERTRAAIVDAAMALLREGMTPSVPAAAEKARVSRATAYRYFPTQEALLTEVLSITPITEPVEQAVREFAAEDPEQRLVRLLDLFNGIVVAHEGQYRAALRVYLDTWFKARNADREANGPPVRAGRRMRWLDETLAPLRPRLSRAAWRRLRAGLALTLGIDSIVIMKDVCGLKNDEALAALRWAAVTMLRAATAADGRASEETSRDGESQA
jgi:AcrR family transcriptional regulator